MATLNQIAERIAMGLNKERNIAFMEAVKFSIKHYRALYIRRDIERNEVSDGYLQRTVFPVKKEDILSQSDISSGRCISRTVDPIPAPVRLKTGNDFKFVGSPITGEAFMYLDETAIFDLQYSRASKDAIAFNYRNGYLEFYNTCDLNYAVVIAAFEDPTEVNKTATEATCITDDTEFPCPADIVQNIIDGIVKGEIQLLNDNHEINLNEQR